MSAPVALRHAALAAALGVGFIAQLLLRVPGEPGLNFFLSCLVGVLAVLWLVRRRGWAASRESLLMLFTALAFTAALAWRDAHALGGMNLLAAFLLATLASARAGEAWAGRALFAESIFRELGVGLSLAAGPFGWTAPPGEPRGGSARWRRPALALLRGVLLAVPLLLVFTQLLADADPVFERLLDNAISVELGPLFERAALTAVFAWLAAGYLRAFIPRDPLVRLPTRVGGGVVGIIDVSTALWLVNALFLAFIVVQLRYLFGGADIVTITPGLGYAEYARRGFFELVTVAALVVPVLMLAEWAVRIESPRDQRLLRATSYVQIALLFVIIVSAAYRMRLYQQAYGLTELRLYVSVFMGWIAFLLAWLAATVLRGRRQYFLSGGLAAAVLCAIGLNTVNPQALIVRVNADRALAGREHDVAYAAGLGADAVPALARLLPRLPQAQQCAVRATWDRLLMTGRDDWRTWNYSVWRARRIIARMPAPAGCPPPQVDTTRGAVDSP